MDIIAKDAATILCREMVDGRAVFIRRPVPARLSDDEFMSVFNADASLMEGLTAPTILRYDEKCEGGWIMKMPAGCMSLFDMLARRPSAICSPNAVQTIAKSLIQHLEYIHRRGLWMVQLTVHNILVTPSLQVKVMPPLSPYLDLAHSLFDGVGGMAPEVLQPSEVSMRTDFYGLAGVLKAFDRFSPLPYSLRALVNCCAMEDAAQRPANCNELLRLIEHADGQGKAIPYAVGVLAFIVLSTMFWYIVRDEPDMPDPDARYIEPQKLEPSPGAVPDSVNIVIEQYKEFLRDSLDEEVLDEEAF